jgi:hypothetical protein
VLAHGELAQQDLRRFFALHLAGVDVALDVDPQRLVARTDAGLASFRPAPTTVNGMSRPS